VCLAVLLGLLVFVAAEVASIVILASHVGSLHAAGVVGVGFLLGLLLLTGRPVRTLKAAADAWGRGRAIGPVVASSALGAGAGVLFLIPGLVSDALALALLVPPVRARLARRMVDRVRRHALDVRGPGAVIDADAVEVPPDDRRGGDPPPALP
jgi:UPF0716 protein FxsA